MSYLACFTFMEETLMIRNNGDTKQEEERRLRVKTQDQRLVRMTVAGTRLSPWEAGILCQMVHGVYFAEPQDRPLRSGQIRYECVKAAEGAGKPLEECQLVTVVLTLFHQDGQGLDHSHLRQQRILRLTEEAREQGGLLSQEDLGRLLGCDERSIRRDVRELREQRGIFVATRGQQKDIGPGVTHRGIALKHWPEGHEPLEVARRINHSLGAVERYIHHFCRVVFLRRKDFKPLQIALNVGISSASTRAYLAIYHQARKNKHYCRRLHEIDLIRRGPQTPGDQKGSRCPSLPGGLRPGRLFDQHRNLHPSQVLPLHRFGGALDHERLN
jgi:biotin operon repressor